MRTDIQFEKIDVKKQPKIKQITLIFLSVVFFALVSCFTIMQARAYFTSTSTKSGDLTFGSIEVKLLNGTKEFNASSFKTKYLTNLLPGSTLNFNDITVKNTGTHSAYVLLNLDVSIPSADGDANKLLHYNKWFNVYGEEVNTANMAINQTKPTLISSGSSLTSNIKWTLPGEVVDNKYQTSTATVNLSVFGCQTNLKEAQAYVDPELYTTYCICTNASKIATDNGITYLGEQINADPLRKVVGKNLFNPNNYTIVNGYLAFDISDLKLGETYTLSCSSALGWIKISNTKDGYSSVQHTDRNNTTKTFTFVMSKHENIAESTTQYLFLGLYSGLYTDISSISGNNIQIEKGSTATEFEAYNAVEDTFDFDTKTLTRNVKKYEFTGEETGWGTYTYGEEGLSFRHSMFTDKSLGFNMSICSHFENVKRAWGTSYVGLTGIYSDHSDHTTQYFRAPYGRSDIDTIEEWKAWLAEQYANGTPVTVWYISSATEEDKQETVLTSKNLYNGPQKLKYEKSALDNTTDITGRILITKNATADYSSLNKELGGDVFDYILNKEFVISAKIKHYEDDEVTGLGESVEFFYGYICYLDSTSNILDYQYFSVEKTIDEFGHYFFSNKAILPNIEISNVSRIQIDLRSYSDYGTYSHFEIKDIQLEVGTMPTSFELYDSTEYQRVNGTILRQIGETKDTYDVTTKKVTRNINRLDITGTESWQDTWTPAILMNLSSSNYGLPQGTAIVVCSHAPSTSSTSVFGARITNDSGSAIGFSQCLSGFGVSDLNGFKNYLKAEKANGNPVRMWYVLNTAKTEQLS